MATIAAFVGRSFAAAVGKSAGIVCTALAAGHGQSFGLLISLGEERAEGDDAGYNEGCGSDD